MCESILAAFESFPVKISSSEGRILKNIFTLVEEREPENKFSKSIRHKYKYPFKKFTYTLIVEYLFRDNETLLDINRAIGMNYYLNRSD